FAALRTGGFASTRFALATMRFAVAAALPIMLDAGSWPGAVAADPAETAGGMALAGAAWTGATACGTAGVAAGAAWAGTAEAEPRRGRRLTASALGPEPTNGFMASTSATAPDVSDAAGAAE